MGRRAQRGAHGTSEGVLVRHWGAQRGMKAQQRRGLMESSARGMETWQEKYLQGWAEAPGPGCRG